MEGIQRKNKAKDLERRKELHARGFHRERGGIHEKMLDRFASPVQRAELPVEGSDAGIGVAVTTGSSGLKTPLGFERTLSPLSSVSSVSAVKKGGAAMREVL